MSTETKFDSVIDPLIRQAGLDLSYRSGQRLREDMKKAGMTDAEIQDVVDKAFEWRYVHS